MKMPHRRLMLCGCAALWLMLFFGWKAQQPSSESAADAPEAPPAADEARTPPAPTVSSAARSGTSRAHVSGAARQMRLGKLIAGIQLDKRQVCPGEDVQVNLTPVAGHDAPIDFSVQGQFGNPVVFSPDTTGERTYHVVATDHGDVREYQQFQVTVLPPIAPECVGRKSVRVTTQLRSEDTVIAKVETSKFQGELQYAWDFGDGTRETSSHPWARHSYANREQNKPMSSFVVRVEVTDATGATQTGRASVTFENRYNVARRISGNRMLPASADHFPRRAGGQYLLQASVRNIEATTVHLDTATLKLRKCSDPEQVTSLELPGSVLGALQAIGPRETAQTTLSFPQGLIPEDICIATLEMTGDTDPPLTGTMMTDRPVAWKPVNALLAFNVRPPAAAPRPPLSAGAPIPPEQLAKLRKASELLGRPHVTAEDLELLTLEGKL